MQHWGERRGEKSKCRFHIIIACYHCACLELKMTGNYFYRIANHKPTFSIDLIIKNAGFEILRRVMQLSCGQRGSKGMEWSKVKELAVKSRFIWVD